MTEQEVLQAAAQAFREADELKKQQAEMDLRLRQLCNDWRGASRQWGVNAFDLRRACIMHGLI